jgi:hypothetical protein
MIDKSHFIFVFMEAEYARQDNTPKHGQTLPSLDLLDNNHFEHKFSASTGALVLHKFVLPPCCYHGLERMKISEIGWPLMTRYPHQSC